MPGTGYWGVSGWIGGGCAAQASQAVRFVSPSLGPPGCNTLVAGQPSAARQAHLSLAPQVLSMASVPQELFQLVCAYNRDLLGLEREGRTVLVERLVELIRVGGMGGEVLMA